jgi:uncharacterized protein YrrD
MTLLLRSSELIGRPVVTLDGDDIGEVKDVLLRLESECLAGFTLRGRKVMASPHVPAVAWSDIVAIGRDAVMIPAVDQFSGEPPTADGGDDVLDVEVISEAGERLGRIVDVVIETGKPARIVGFEVEASTQHPGEQPNVLIPADEIVSSSSRAMVVPAEARHYVRDDLTGFGSHVATTRTEGAQHAAE